MSTSASLSGSGAAAQPSPWRSIGLWMAAIVSTYILVNVIRSMLNPIEFAAYFGTPLSTTDNPAFVFVYAIRSLFLGLFGWALLICRKYAALTLYALIATLMPIGDATLVALSGGTLGTILRHIATAGFLLLTWYFMRRWQRVALRDS